MGVCRPAAHPGGAVVELETQVHRVDDGRVRPYRSPRGAWLRFLRLGSNVPGPRNVLPMMAHASTAPGS